MKLKLTVVLVAMGISSLSQAQTEREHDSHEHGHALLNVAIEDASLLIELETPWNNLVGFEHAPSTEDQHAMVDKSLALLDNPSELFSFKGTGCTATEMMLDNSMAEGDEHDDDHKDEHDHDDDHKDEHDDHKDEHAHDDHKDEHDDHKDEHAHDDHDEDEETHSSLLAAYTFDCDDVSKLTAINADLLKVWSGFEELDVQLVGPGGQDQQELDPDNITVDVSGVQ